MLGGTTVRLTGTLNGEFPALAAVIVNDPVYVPAVKPVVLTATVTLPVVVPVLGVTVSQVGDDTA
jgi:hypothetical protein